jgi:hypothetical protein
VRTLASLANVAKLSLLVLLCTGCAHVEKQLGKSLQDGALTTRTCTAVNQQVGMSPGQIRADIKDVAEEVLGLNLCQPGEDRGTCISSLRDAISKLQQSVRAAIRSGLATKKITPAQAGEIEATLQRLSKGLLDLRKDLSGTVESFKELRAGAACQSPKQCTEQFKRLALEALRSTEGHWIAAAEDLETLSVQLGAFLADLEAERKAFAQTQDVLQHILDARLKSIGEFLASGNLLETLEELARKLGEQEAGRVAVRLLDRSTYSIDRFLGRVDEKVWFVASLSVAAHDAEIRHAFKDYFEKYFKLNGQYYHDTAIVALVYAACQELADPERALAAATRGSYLLYPMFSGMILAYPGEGTTEDAAVDRLTTAVAAYAAEVGNLRLDLRCATEESKRRELRVKPKTGPSQVCIERATVKGAQEAARAAVRPSK